MTPPTSISVDYKALYECCVIVVILRSLLWHCWLVVMKSMWPVKIECWSTCVVNCLDTTTTTVLWPFTAFCPALPGWAGTRRNTHPPTILIIIQSLSVSSIYHNPEHPPCSNYVVDNLFAQPLSMSSLVYLFVWSPPPHIPYISSPNHLSSFRSTCPYHRNLFCCSINITSSIASLSLNSLLGTLSFALTLHIHLAVWSEVQMICILSSWYHCHLLLC